MFRRLPTALICICIGVGLLGVVGSLVPALSVAEENIGLHTLYLLRGVKKPRADVVVVAINRESAKALNLPAAPHKWPRNLHARLLERLTTQGAAVVAFDLIFYEPQTPSNDHALASAIRRAGNVILTQSIDRQNMAIADHNDTPTAWVNIDKIVASIPLVADAAIGQAPFPLPKVPAKLNQYWRFSPGSGDLPTLPVVVMHAFAMNAFYDFFDLFKSVDPAAAATLKELPKGEGAVRQVIETIRPLFVLFEKDPTLAGRMTDELNRRAALKTTQPNHRLVRAFIELYGAGTSGYLNLYGPAGTVDTISYHRLVGPTDPGSDHPGKSLPSLRGKAVFVGQTESDWYKANDGFYTAFTQPSGMDISGVELAATAFANLLEGKAVHPIGPAADFAIHLGWGIAGTLIAIHFASAVSAAGLVLLNGIYVGAAYLHFKSGGIWYPLVIPILVQTPAAFIAGLLWRYRKANTERRNIREAFGYYLPDEVVSRLAANVQNLRTGGQVLYSICLFTDAENYTTLSETLDPESLTRLMNTYYEAIFKPIRENEGLVLQVVGDSVLALWSAPQPKNELKTAACKAAIGITHRVEQFNTQAGQYSMPTRIGIHAGEILLGNIGAIDHFEYRPVGDIVNTASRLEGLNKFLKTRMLVSQEAFVLDSGYRSRLVGRFVFKGKSQPVQVHEIGQHPARGPQEQVKAYHLFESGLQAFTHQRWDEAELFFSRVLQMDETDGPSQFYRTRCREFRKSPPEKSWNGAVHLNQK
jgi:adenylate cyclase